jgi:flagellar basal body-associated protein FliL
MLDHIRNVTAMANTVAKQEKEALANLEISLRLADQAIEKELNRILHDQMMRRAVIMTALDKIKSGLGGQAQINGAIPPALPINSDIDLPRIVRNAKDAG